MFTVSYQPVIDWLSRLGFGGLLVLAIVGFQQGWWVFARERDREREEWREQMAAVVKDRDEWKLLYLTSVRAGERVAAVAAKALPAA